MMIRKQKRIPVKVKKQEKQIPVQHEAISNSEMIEFLKTQGYLVDQNEDKNENV